MRMGNIHLFFKKNAVGWRSEIGDLNESWAVNCEFKPGQNQY